MRTEVSPEMRPEVKGCRHRHQNIQDGVPPTNLYDAHKNAVLPDSRQVCHGQPDREHVAVLVDGDELSGVVQDSALSGHQEGFNETVVLI